IQIYPRECTRSCGRINRPTLSRHQGNLFLSNYQILARFFAIDFISDEGSIVITGATSSTSLIKSRLLIKI
ncbi:unnamed protein product, partial [Rotaria magnacalcarata]